MSAFSENSKFVQNYQNALPPAITESARKNAVCGGIRILPEIPPNEISLIGAHFGGTEEWRKILKTDVSQRTLDAVWGGIRIPPRIPHDKIPMIYAPLVRMGGMGGNF